MDSHYLIVCHGVLAVKNNSDNNDKQQQQQQEQLDNNNNMKNWLLARSTAKWNE